MKKISDITSYVDENDEFTDGKPESGVRPTPLLAAWFNVIQRELVKVVESAGLTLDPTDDTQLWQALSKYFVSSTDMNTAIGALGTMASQNSDAVDITGGAITGTSVTGDLTGNADTATKLQTARKINGVDFDGTADITISSGMVTGVRLGTRQNYSPTNNESTWDKSLDSGNVMTGIYVQDTGSNSADNIARIYYRPVQYCINGSWVTASSI
ncbi:phage tail protein [Escherichia coli]|nr:phage tail protein [Escherichia coli]EHM4561339.1 phage tail protein [Escherichia coli]